MYGRLRISVTHDCQLSCQFCHREGIANHWQPIHIDVSFFRKLVEAYASIKGRYVELTGGEPTLHPSIGKLISLGANSGCRIVLCTNGLELDRAIPQIRSGLVSLVRLSLHYDNFGDSAIQHAHEILGPAWDYDKIERNLNSVLDAQVPLQIVFTHAKKNNNQLREILRRAVEWNISVQIVDVIASRVGDPSNSLGYMSGEQSEAIVKEFAKLEQVVQDRTGSVLKLYRTYKGVLWEVKDYHVGVLHSSMCDNCQLRPFCGEGVYALRVDAFGLAKPCLLRSDLEKSLMHSPCRKKDLAESLRQILVIMLADPLEWSFENVINAPTL